MENTPMLPLLRWAIFRWRVKPQRVIGDTTYGTAENSRAREQSGIRAAVPLPDWDQRTPYYDPSLFTSAAERDVSHCPQGATRRRRTANHTTRTIGPMRRSVQRLSDEGGLQAGGAWTGDCPLIRR